MSYETVEDWPWEKLVSKEDLLVLNICLIAKTFVVKTTKNCGYFAHFLLNRSPMRGVKTFPV